MMNDPNQIASIIVREAGIDDIPFLRTMLWEALMASPTFMQELGLEAIQQHEDDYWRNWAMQPEPAFIAQDGNGRLLGAISLRPEGSEKPVQCWRLAIGVEREARGQGVGRRLIEHVLAFAKAEGTPNVSLLVDPANLPAIALYRKTGFVEVGTRGSVIEMRVQVAVSD